MIKRERVGNQKFKHQDRIYSRMQDMRGVIHSVLQSTVEMWECLGAAAEAHVLAEVVATFVAVAAVVAHDASLDGDSLTDDKVFDTWAYGCDDSRGFMAEDEGRLESKVSVSTMEIVVDCRHGKSRYVCRWG